MTARRSHILLGALAALLLVALPLLGVLQMRWARELQDTATERTRLEIEEALGELASGLAAELVRWNADVQAYSVGDLRRPENPRPDWPRESGFGRLVEAVYLEIPDAAEAAVPDGAAPAWFSLPPEGPAVEMPTPPDLAIWVEEWRKEKSLPGLLPRLLEEERMVFSARVAFEGRTLEEARSSADLVARAPVLWMVVTRAGVASWVESEAQEAWRWHRQHLDYWLIFGEAASGERRLVGGSGPALPPVAASAPQILRASVDLNRAFGEALTRLTSATREDRESAAARGTAAPAEPVVFMAMPGVGDRWSLEVEVHRSAVDPRLRELWHRNLAVGLAALAVLAVAVALLMALTVQSQRLARARFDFMTGVTHELRTPLSVLRSASANLSDGVVQEPSQVRQYGEVMTQEVRRLGDLVERILGLTRAAEAAEGAEADVRASVERVLERFQGEIAEAGARVRVEVDPELPPLRAHPWALDSLLQNLLGNALKYGGREIAVEASASRLRWRPAVEVAVRDRGRGLGRAERRRVFEPFFRGRRALEEQKPGTGLGLSWVAQLARRYGGRVIAESRPGRGSRFGVALPIAAPAPEASP
ncbi:MAG: HAMP domain-containing sensor histidine kinase [Acidobacteriota bacterium]